MNERMSDERLAEIRARLRAAKKSVSPWAGYDELDADELLREVERARAGELWMESAWKTSTELADLIRESEAGLRADIAALEAENARLREAMLDVGVAAEIEAALKEKP